MTTVNNLGFAADGKTELIHLTGHPLLVSAVEFNKVIAQRDELLAALKKMLGYAENWPNSFTAHDCWKRDAAKARAAIAKVEQR